MRRLGARVLLISGTLAAAVYSPAAEAFCRSTTCVGMECQRDENGCKTTGEKLFWRSSCVAFSVNTGGTKYIAKKYIDAAINTSFFAWTSVACEAGGNATISFSPFEGADCRRTEYNDGGTNANIVLFQDDKWKYLGVENNIAKTTVTFDDDTGEILDADIEVNHTFNDITVDDTIVHYDLQSILTHEIGHFIGLDHSVDDLATMYAGYEEGSIEPRTLEPDDLAAACEVYAPGRAAACTPEPRGGFSNLCGGVPAGPPGSEPEESCAITPPGRARGAAAWKHGISALGLMALIFVSRRRAATKESR